MSAPQVKGWCPGALRPMLSGDGWLVRIRPPGGLLTPDQASGLAAASLAHGCGVMDLSARANLQLRGVREAAHPALIADLDALGLVDPDIASETVRNIVVTPFHAAGDGTADLAAALAAALARELPALPGKFGFAVDTGPAPVLAATPADIRLERTAGGALLLRADGHALGRVVGAGDAVAEALALARWFLAQGGAPQGRGRMAGLIARGIRPEGADTAPARAVPPPGPGIGPEGALVGFAFGQMRAETLLALAQAGHPLRLTPWRMILLSGAGRLPQGDGLLTDPADPLLRVTACSGAPHCPQARGETRDLARALAADLPAGLALHVSGCTKGCAHPAPSAVTLVANGTGYDLIRKGRAGDPPFLTDLPPHLIAAQLKAPDAPSL